MCNEGNDKTDQSYTGECLGCNDMCNEGNDCTPGYTSSSCLNRVYRTCLVPPEAVIADTKHIVMTRPSAVDQLIYLMTT